MLGFLNAMHGSALLATMGVTRRRDKGMGGKSSGAATRVRLTRQESLPATFC